MIQEVRFHYPCWSCVNRFLDPTGVPVRVSNKRFLVPKRVVSGLVGVLRNGGGLDNKIKSAYEPGGPSGRRLTTVFVA